jgi:hypothetical protein
MQGLTMLMASHKFRTVMRVIQKWQQNDSKLAAQQSAETKSDFFCGKQKTV